MSQTAVIVCPGRGTYNKAELGYLARHHADQQALFDDFDAIRSAAGQAGVTELDGADTFSAATYSRGDVASPLIFAASLADARSIDDDIEIVAVTGNSMGWYIALAVAGAVSPTDGFTIVNTMGTLMHEHLIGGQLVYPFVDEDWRADNDSRQKLLDTVATINADSDKHLALSIDLGGMLVIAGDEAGLKAFEQAVPKRQERYPMRLMNHAAFHTALQQPVSDAGRAQLGGIEFGQPQVPLIDGRGHVWWPHASDTTQLRYYTLGHQVTRPYDFTGAVQAAACEFAPDLFIVTGPGTTLGGAVIQSLLQIEWLGLRSKQDFVRRQESEPLLVSMGMASQRATATHTS
ncbi:MAG: ACP S-malonyltransferase [Pseudomonadota bacterium]